MLTDKNILVKLRDIILFYSVGQTSNCHLFGTLCAVKVICI